MFMDTEGKVAIDLAGMDIDGVSVFKEGLCGVSKNEKWGFIDRTGKLVIPIKYYWPYFNTKPVFDHGLCLTAQFGLVSAINREGKEVIPPVCRRIHWLVDDLFLVVFPDGSEGALNHNGEGVLYDGYQSIELRERRLIAVKDGERLEFDLQGDPIES